ncbi:putative gustatory receptor 94a [Drosophila grimshawi]|uniref:Gustatory receptor n=1 Tax=Drosophila grimshawi TaxID=7222 RepID=B4JSF5_DROGR|nr:putative gustatory receptor 94a [Drosophila grimshawi]EDV94695.1 GH22382 [Drosophila grimshawi]
MASFGISRLSRRPIRGQAKLIQMLLALLISVLTLFGLFAIRYNRRGRQRFVSSRKYLAYAIMVTVLFSSIYVRQMYEDYMKSQLNLHDAVKLYSYMNITVAIINFVTQMLVSDRVAKMMSNVPLFTTLDEFQLDKDTVRNSVVAALVKGIGFPLAIEIALILQQRRHEPDLNWAWSLYKLLPMVISNLLNSCYFGAMIITKNIVEALNERLNMQVQQVNLLQHDQQKKLHSNYYRIQRYCSLADQIDVLAEKYHIICTQSEKYMALMSLSIVLSLICHLLGITIGFFDQYYAIAESVIGRKPYDAFGALINLMFLGISIAEIGLLTYVSNDILVATQSTGSILEHLQLQQVDWRYQQSVHAFSLQVIAIKFKITPMGLFEIDISLITSILSTVATFSVILVQSDLSQRFK